MTCFRQQIQIWEQAVRSIIGLSTTRCCFPSMPLEPSGLQCRWTERSEKVTDLLNFNHYWIQHIWKMSPNIFWSWSLNFSLWLSVTLKMKGHYFLVVEASDGAVDPRRSRLTLSVTVLDVDDNSPIFSQQSFDVNLPENTPKDTVILQLKVGFCLGWENQLFMNSMASQIRIVLKILSFFNNSI